MSKPEQFSIRFSDLRFKAQIDQRILARRLKVARLTIINWEAGRTYPTYWTLLEIAKYFNVDLNWLMGHDRVPVRDSAR